MASTYTSNTGIEKPGTGEQSGTWGSTTNINFDIIDRAINGVGNITLSGTTHTLTTSDGTLSDGMYKVLVLGGSPSGTNTITIAPNDAAKAYLVNNTTAQTATFTQGSGGDVSLAAGASAWIYADGGGSGAQVRQLPADLVGDTTPQLGGNLDLNSNDITGTGNLNTTGNITASGNLTISTGTATVGTIDFGDWTITESGGVLYFATSGTNKMKLDATGNLTVTGDITAFGTI